ncbi:phosphatidylethanolamine N-methyltransferase [Lithohypha guttulata]|uniref:Phosphatidylethanolamine N-methyltransferase n=1 Tax=Lithohypha guttulata TaxID=1690604 RepID=A0AAN7T031_9EURO|nr:phosphatidylethanolamine N-methyltransferase [Lithohypha guttulata]
MAQPDSLGTEGLRQRNVPLQAASEEEARQAVLQLNSQEENTKDADNEKRTFGRTPGGTVFVVPETKDMVSQLLSPSEPKNISDLLILAVLASMISLLWLPKATQVPTFGCLFVFWRLSYNIGIGWLLRKQSKQQTLVRWARKSKLFGKPSATEHPRLRAFIKSELEKKIVRNYDFDDAPLEYNTWLVFRRIVDLILMCDFTSYMLFAVASCSRPIGEFFLTTITRWIVAAILVAFNLWVKLDAHRVVKDFAWYWGVFELAPHPMYSIGYIGYYGIALATASYQVLFLSLFGQANQFFFLWSTEQPHIDRIYSSPPSRKQLDHSPQKPPETHNTLSLDLYRVTDTSTIIIQILLFLLTIVTPKSAPYKALFLIAAVLCRVWFSLGLGYLLDRQSEKQAWTRHFLKHGESTGEAFRQWKGIYHMSMTLSYATFAALTWKSYHPPSAWDEDLVLLRHVFGLSLVALQIWVAVSVYQQLGEYGWFYGDFFFFFENQSSNLSYSGIYRFLNNPGRVLGLAGLWGCSIITKSKSVLGLTILSHVLEWFLGNVERKHMMKLYGRHIREDSGMVRVLKRSLPPPLRQLQDSLEKRLATVLDSLEEYFDAAKPQLEARFTNVVGPTRSWLSQYPASLAIINSEMDTTNMDTSDYAIEVIGDERICEKNASDSILQLEYGSPIKVKWTAPPNHSKRDWIGLYSLASRNTSRQVTHIPSKGRWIATNSGEYDDVTPEQGIIASDVKVTRPDKVGHEVELMTGEVLFAGEKLFWEQGIFEFRYHHNGKHNVMAISQPFEIRIPRFNEDNLGFLDSSGDSLSSIQTEEFIQRAIEKTLLPVVRNCFERDPEIAPSTPQETYGGLIDRNGKWASRVVYFIQHAFGLELHPQVVKADGRISNLAFRIVEAGKILQPYSMSKSRGTSTPVK